MKNRPTRFRRRFGMTLTELLVVILIISVVFAAALPLMRTSVEDRAMREGSRQLNTYVQLAKAQAAETNRPVGLWLDTELLPESPDWLSGQPNPQICYARQVFLAQAPPPYSGDIVGATVTVSSTQMGTNARTGLPIYNAQFDTAEQQAASGTFFTLVSVGDRIKFDYKGPEYEIVSTASPALTFECRGEQPSPRDGHFKYQVFRFPQKSSRTPMELSGGAVIDLNNSGIGLTGRELRGNMDRDQRVYPTTSTHDPNVYPIVIMFHPDGSVDRILGRHLPSIPLGTIHLMVGSLEGTMEPGTASSALFGEYNKNLEDPANLWVSIGHQTGKVITSRNAWALQPTLAASLAWAREFAQQGYSEGGR